MTLPVVLKDYSVSYGREPVLNSLNFQLKKGRRHLVLGPSGCGKSTLLNAIANTLPKSATPQGSIQILPGLKTAQVFQDYGLFPWKTVYQNLTLPLKLVGSYDKRVDPTRIMTILDRLGLGDKREVYPHTLSGGQKQRVALGRIWLQKPDLLLLDEPFSALDAITRESLQDDLLVLCQEEKPTMLMVTHSIEEAVSLGQEIYLMDQKGGLTLLLRNDPPNAKAFRESQAFYDHCFDIRQAMKGSL